MMPRQGQTRKQPPGQRQLRVGEEIRHALSTIFLRGELHEPALRDASVTVSEVRISPDLKNATAYIMPLGGSNSDEVVTALQDLAPNIRTMVGSKIHLKYTPRISFRLDNSFDEAHRINALLQQPDVIRDIEIEKNHGEED
ncbi:MAG: 30S ribosome-binding factor RbfA [Alphaproteobacteria bacterium]|nr:30S ribosome-binding factor RbfA [Alphaproteobacteria bacterium]